MEFCEGGSLDQIDCTTLTESKLKDYIIQIVNGVEYLHNEKKIIHRVKQLYICFDHIGFKVSKYITFEWKNKDNRFRCQWLYYNSWL